MIQNLDKVVESYLRPGEEPLWYGQPPDDPAVKHLRPILAALGWFGIFFVVLAIFQLYYDLGGMEGLADFKRQISFSNLVAQCRYSLALLLVASGLFIVRGILPGSVKTVNNTIYLVTNQRIAIIEHGDSPKIREFGPGEIRNPGILDSDPPNPQTLRVGFVQVPRKMVSGINPHFSRAELHWDGFPFVKKKEAEKALAAVQEWIMRHKGEMSLENELLNFRVSLFKNWTIRTLFIEKNNRDNLLLSVLACEFLNESNILPFVPSSKEWNTLLMSRHMVTTTTGEHTESHHFKIIVEGALSSGRPSGITHTGSSISPELLKLLTDPSGMGKLLKDQLLICQLDNLLQQKDDGTYKLKVHPKVKPVKLNAMNNYEITTSLNINGVEYRVRQVYAYQEFIRDERKADHYPPDPRQSTLHLRFTFICPGLYFKENNKLLNKIVQSTRILEDLSSSAQESESLASREATGEG